MGLLLLAACTAPTQKIQPAEAPPAPEPAEALTALSRHEPGPTERADTPKGSAAAERGDPERRTETAERGDPEMRKAAARRTAAARWADPARRALPPPRGASVEERPLHCWVYGHGAKTLLALGGIHGDEPAGTVLLKRFCTHLELHPEHLDGVRAVVAPALNPDGLERNRRSNARGVDLNRNFSARNRRSVKARGSSPLSEPESRFIAGLIERYRPDRIVSVHQPAACVDWDGPARELAGTVSRACGLPVRKLGPRPGSLGQYAGVELAIPVITLELPSRATGMEPDALWEAYGDALLAMLRFDGDEYPSAR